MMNTELHILKDINWQYVHYMILMMTFTVIYLEYIKRYNNETHIYTY